MDFGFGNFRGVGGNFGDFGDSYFSYDRVLKAKKNAEEESQKRSQEIMDTIRGDWGKCNGAKHYGMPQRTCSEENLADTMFYV